MFRRMIFLSAALLATVASADSLKLSHGSVLNGTLQSVTVRSGGQNQTFTRKQITSVAVGGPTGGDSLVIGEKTVSGLVQKVEFKTIGGVMSFSRERIVAVELDAAGAADPKPSPKPHYADRIRLSLPHKLVAEVMQVSVREGQTVRRLYRSKITSIALNSKTLDAVELTDGRRVIGRVEMLRARLAAGIVDFGRKELVGVKLGLATADNPGPVNVTSEPTPDQKVLIAANAALRGEYQALIAKARAKAVADVDDSFQSDEKRAQRQFNLAEGIAKGLLDRANLTKANISTAEREMENSRKQQVYWREQQLNRLRARYDREVDLYRKAASKAVEAKSDLDGIEKQKTSQRVTFDKWAAEQNTAVMRVSTKHNFLIRAGAPLTREKMSKAYRDAMTLPPEVQRARRD